MPDDRTTRSPSHMDVSGMVEDGVRLARNGHRVEAEALFRRVVQLAPETDEGWLWMAWLADDREASLRYLREGLRFAPDSPSLREGVAWVEAHRPAAVPAGAAASRAAGQPAMPEPSTRSRRVRRDRVERSRAAAPAAPRAVRPTDSRVVPASPRFGRRRVSLAGIADRVKSVGVYAVGIVGIAVLVAVVSLVARQALGETPAVSAMVLPTAVINATPTPGVESRLQPLWTRVEIAFGQEDWDDAIGALDQVRKLDPQSVPARERLSAALYERARDSIAANELEAASRDLDRAVRLDADSPNLQSTRRDIELYRSAVEAYLEQNWSAAVDLLTQVHERTPGFRDTSSMLGHAHCYLSEEQLAAQNFDEALNQATLCEQILQGDPDAAALVTRVMETIRPPRRIEVSLSNFRTSVYEDNKVINTFPICYGRPSHPTKTGRFEVLDKMDSAYGSAWDLDMPWWLGIYWAGGTENGFHALPILSSGATLWSGSLGTRCSFGCIVLDTKDAKWLYDWATIGTVVFVNE